MERFLLFCFFILTVAVSWADPNSHSSTENSIGTLPVVTHPSLFAEDVNRINQTCRPYCDVLFAPKPGLKSIAEINKFPENWVPVEKNAIASNHIYRDSDGCFTYGDTREKVAFHNGQTGANFKATKVQGPTTGLSLDSPEIKDFFTIVPTVKFDPSRLDCKNLAWQKILNSDSIGPQAPTIFTVNKNNKTVARAFVQPQVWQNYFVSIGGSAPASPGIGNIISPSNTPPNTMPGIAPGGGVPGGVPGGVAPGVAPGAFNGAPQIGPIAGVPRDSLPGLAAENVTEVEPDPNLGPSVKPKIKRQPQRRQYLPPQGGG